MMQQSHDDFYTRATVMVEDSRAWQQDYETPDWDDPAPASDPPARPHGGIGIPLFLLVALVVCVASALLVPGGLGAYVGYQQLQEQNHEAAIQHFNRGLGYLAENYPELAYAEFEIALKYDGAYEPAQQKSRELQATVGGRGTPGPQKEEDRVAVALYDEARRLIAQKQWSDAILRLEQLRTLKADYRVPEVSAMLFQAYLEGGKEAVALGQIELARGRFESALVLRSSDAEAQRHRDLAVLYLDAQQTVGYNWQVAVQKFSTLYQKDPNYDDVKSHLFEAHVQYGDQAAKQNAWCLAAREYEGALALANDGQLAQKRAQAMSLCKQAIVATPTPTVAASAENYVFKISTASDKPCTGAGDISGVVRDALNRPIPNAMIAYSADGISTVSMRTNTNGQYQFILGKDTGLFHVVVLSADGKTPATLAADVQYPGGNNAGCHIVIDWQKLQ
jgi:tetratricopeptide (TPR) repeat protein